MYWPDLRLRSSPTTARESLSFKDFAFLALSNWSCWLYLMVKSIILYLRDAHHLFPVTAPTNVRWIRFSSCHWKSHISSKEVLNFQLLARLGLFANRRLTLTSLWSIRPNHWNVGQVTMSLSALLTLCPGKTEPGQRANFLARSTSPSLGDQDGTCRSNRTRPQNRPGCCHTFPTHQHPDRPYLYWDQGSHSNHPLELSASKHPGTTPTAERKSVSLQQYWAHKPQLSEIRRFHGNISYNQPAPVTCKDKIDNCIEAAFNYQRDPNIEVAPECWKDDKVALQHPTVRLASEVSLLHCINIYVGVREFSKQVCTLACIPQSPRI